MSRLEPARNIGNARAPGRIPASAHPDTAPAAATAGEPAAEASPSPPHRLALAIRGVLQRRDAVVEAVGTQYAELRARGDESIDDNQAAAAHWSEGAGAAQRAAVRTASFAIDLQQGAADGIAAVARLLNGTSQVTNPYEWAARPAGNLERVRDAGQALASLGATATPAAWLFPAVREHNGQTAATTVDALAAPYRGKAVGEQLGRGAVEIGGILIGASELKPLVLSKGVRSDADKLGTAPKPRRPDEGKGATDAAGKSPAVAFDELDEMVVRIEDDLRYGIPGFYDTRGFAFRGAFGGPQDGGRLFTQGISKSETQSVFDPEAERSMHLREDRLRRNESGDYFATRVYAHTSPSEALKDAPANSVLAPGAARGWLAMVVEPSDTVSTGTLFPGNRGLFPRSEVSMGNVPGGHVVGRWPIERNRLGIRIAGEFEFNAGFDRNLLGGGPPAR